METILLQQTDPAVLEVATLTLEENYRVIAIGECPSDLIQLIEKKRPSLIILDYIIDGKKAIKALLKIRKLTSKIPVIAMSCNNDIETQAAINGFDGCLKKPFDLDELTKLAEIFILSTKKRLKESDQHFCVNS